MCIRVSVCPCVTVFVIEREEGRAVAGVEDNKVIASAARPVFPLRQRTLEKEKI